MRSLSQAFSKIRQIRSRNAVSICEPPAVWWLLEHREEYQGKSALRKGTTPTASLYRMYEHIVAGFTIGLRNEIEHFFNQSAWAVSEIPDPKDPDRERYAILAVLPHYLVVTFNRLIERGMPRDCPAIITSREMEEELKARTKVLEQEPSWVKEVPRLEQTLIIPDKNGEVPAEDSRSEPFLRMNIIVEAPHVLFV
ncbi:hypothetical protein BDV25DRAFT_146401 [Aspergillus avenaceus]|uniref:Uncharacterized protein n=1 Tax=Aspergillus avenaceus TaxID=36643 RepID=A0A5N6U9H9_ASPAV|nr:hypothetical protein BDV25DRAFT_146401 [Aspergillus avenaceus]